MSVDEGASPAPVVLDASVLIEAARGDGEIMTLIQGYDAEGRPLLIPVLAVTAAALDTRSEDAEAILYGLERLASSVIVPVQDAEQALALAAVTARTGLDPYDAHAAVIADAEICPILTLDAAKWQEHARDLDEPLHFAEIAEPDGA